MSGGISSSEQQYEEEHKLSLQKEAHIIAVYFDYEGSWDQFTDDFPKMIAERNEKLRGDK